MTRPDDKAKERAQAQAMIDQLPQLGVVEIDPEDRERPDLGLTLANGRTVGLEIVRAIDEEIAAGNGAIEKINRQVLAGLVADGVKAQLVYSMSDGAAAVLATRGMKKQRGAEIAALVQLAKHGLTEAPSPNSRMERRRAARGLEALISPWRHYERFEPDITLDDGTVCWIDPRRGDGSYELAGHGVEFCDRVMVRPLDEPHAGNSGSSFGQPRSIIQDAIDQKSKLLAEYRKSGYDEQWLLVVGSDGTGGVLDIDDAKGEFTSPFDRTFFLEQFSGECVELRIRR